MIPESGAHTSRFRPSALSVFSVLALAAGIALRIYTVLFFEYKTDQALAIQEGRETVSKYFLIDHGMTSSPGVPNPPFFYWAMGVFSFVAETPTHYALIFLGSSFAALAIWIVGFRKLISNERLLLSAALLSVSPPLIIYSCNIWAQALLPVITVSMFVSLCQFLKTKKEFFWILAFWLNALAAGLHLSGFFLFPVTLTLCAYRKVSVKGIVTATVPPAILFLPYAIFLGSFFSRASLVQSSLNWTQRAMRTFNFFSQFNSADFYRYYLGQDFQKVAELSLERHIAEAVIFISGVCSSALVFMGLALILIIIAGRQKFTHLRTGQLPEVALAAVAGLQVISVVGACLLFRVQSYPHYFVATIPAGAVLSTFFLFMLPSKRTREVIGVALLGAMLTMNVCILAYLNRSGGHINEYGIDYGLLKQWKQEYADLRKNHPEVSGIVFHIDAQSSRSFYPFVALSVVDPAAHSLDTVKGNRVVLDVKWDREKLRYEHEWLLGK